ncbi:MAG: hypothetical protein AB7G47_04580 [Mycolicibacterium sp.]
MLSGNAELNRIGGGPWVVLEVLPGAPYGVQALVDPCQGLIEDLELFATSLISGLGGTSGTFGFHSCRTLAP